MSLKIKFRALRLPRRRQPLGNDYTDLSLPELCRGEGIVSAAVLIGLLSVLIVLAAGGLYPFDWLLLGEVLLLALWVTLLSILGLCLLRSRLDELGRITAPLCCFAIIMTATALCSAVGQTLILWWQPLMPLTSFSFWLVLQHMAIAAIPAALVLRQLFLQQQLRQQQGAELEARIQALQSRIRPHFLFNSMNMIASLISSDTAKAERVVEDLADLFRHALADSSTLVPLREELSLCRRYLTLEKLRLGERLETLWEIGDYGAGARIPCLTIQPVLENAVYHGIQLIPQGGVLSVRVSRIGERIDITVTNPRNPRIQHNKGNRMAMSNIRTRLEAHFGPTSLVEAEVTDESYITRISYPVQVEARTS